MLHYKKTNQLHTIVDNYKLPSSLWLFSPASHGRKCPVHKAVWWSAQVISEGKETVRDWGKCTHLFCSTFSLVANLKYQDNLGPWKVFYSQVTQNGALHLEITAFYELIGTKNFLTRETTQPKLYKHVQACSTLQCIVYSKNFQVCWWIVNRKAPPHAFVVGNWKTDKGESGFQTPAKPFHSRLARALSAFSTHFLTKRVRSGCHDTQSEPLNQKQR